MGREIRLTTLLIKCLEYSPKAGRVGFEPTTSSLEGWLAIRAATSAQQLERKIDVQVLRFPIGLTREEEIFLKVIRTAPRTLSVLFNGNN